MSDQPSVATRRRRQWFSPLQKLAVIKRQEFDTEEVDTLLNVASETVKTRLHRARQALRTLLEPLVK